MHPSNITPSPTEIERIASEREINRAQQSDIESQMLALSQRLRELQIEDRYLTIRLINAHFTSAPSIP